MLTTVCSTNCKLSRHVRIENLVMYEYDYVVYTKSLSYQTISVIRVSTDSNSMSREVIDNLVSKSAKHLCTNKWQLIVAFLCFPHAFFVHIRTVLLLFEFHVGLEAIIVQWDIHHPTVLVLSEFRQTDPILFCNKISDSVFNITLLKMCPIFQYIHKGNVRICSAF